MKKKAKKMIVYMGALFVLGMVIICIYHYSLIQKESAILQPNGTLNNVDGQNLHVYQEGLARIHIFLWLAQVSQHPYMS